jgi:hypothetical protein
LVDKHIFYTIDFYPVFERLRVQIKGGQKILQFCERNGPMLGEATSLNVGVTKADKNSKIRNLIYGENGWLINTFFTLRLYPH